MSNIINIININNIFSIGFRCNTDEFLSNFLKIRRYSSPFSYMVIDIKTALNFIDNKFLNYTNKDFSFPGKNTYKFNKKNWTCNNIHKYSILKLYNLFMSICNLLNCYI
jgi:hypothetical protein